jgi:hypothetical protein
MLYLMHFSESSKTALPFASAIARECETEVHALHVLIPDPKVYVTPESTAAVFQG